MLIALDSLLCALLYLPFGCYIGFSALMLRLLYLILSL